MRKRGGEALSVIEEDHESKKSSPQRSRAAKRSSNREEHLEAAAQSERKHILQLAKGDENESKIEDSDNNNYKQQMLE